MPEDLSRHLALLLTEEVHVAVVIVSRVVVVEIRQRAGFTRGAERLVVPIRHHDLAVGVEGRNQQENDVVEHLADGGGIAGGEVVHQFQHHLRGTDFRGVDVIRNEDNRLAGTEDFVTFGVGRGAALEVELTFQVLQAIEVAEVFGRTDLQKDEGVAVRCGAEVPEPDAVRPVGEGLQVLDDLVPANQLPVAADAESEILLGRLNAGGGGEGEKAETGDQAAGSHGQHPWR